MGGHSFWGVKIVGGRQIWGSKIWKVKNRWGQNISMGQPLWGVKSKRGEDQNVSSILLHILSCWVKISLHTEFMLPLLPSVSGPNVCGGCVGVVLCKPISGNIWSMCL